MTGFSLQHGNEEIRVSKKSTSLPCALLANSFVLGTRGWEKPQDFCSRSVTLASGAGGRAGGRGQHPGPGLRPKGRPRSPREPAWQVGQPWASGGAGGGGGRSRAPRDASPTRPDSHDCGCSVCSLRARSLMSAGGESLDLRASASPDAAFPRAAYGSLDGPIRARGVTASSPPPRGGTRGA